MAPNTGRQFKHIFNDAQTQLRSIFGMEMTELPQREKITVSQKRGTEYSPMEAPIITAGLQLTFSSHLVGSCAA